MKNAKLNYLLTLVCIILSTGAALGQSDPLTITPAGKVGIGTPKPEALLHVAGSVKIDSNLVLQNGTLKSKTMHITGGSGFNPNKQGLHLTWNYSSNNGESNFVNHKGDWAGGFTFDNTSRDGSGLTRLMTIDQNGNVIAGGSLKSDADTYLFHKDTHVLRYDRNNTYIFPFGTGMPSNMLVVGGGPNVNLGLFVTGKLTVGSGPVLASDYPVEINSYKIADEYGKPADKYIEGPRKDGMGDGTSKKPISIKGIGGIDVGFGLYIHSDERIKKSITVDNTKEDLKLLNQLPVSSFQYKDKKMYGTGLTKGFIAQQVKQIYPRAVSQAEDFVPSIYAPADRVSLNGDQLTVLMKAPHHLISGDVVRIVTQDQLSHEGVIETLDEKSFRLKGWTGPTAAIFVFGKKVNDFLAVDYQQLFSLGISGIQQLSKETEQLRKEVEILKSQNKQLAELVRTVLNNNGKQLTQNTKKTKKDNRIVVKGQYGQKTRVGKI